MIGIRGLMVASVMILSGCDDADGTGVRIPAIVQQMMDAPFAADGQIHVQKKGQIVIGPETVVCETWTASKSSDGIFGINSRFGINSTELFGALGQTSSSEGGDRQIPANSSACSDSQSVIIHGVKSEDSKGSSYKFGLAVWQGDPASGGSFWVGGLERDKSKLPPPFDIPDLRGQEGEKLSEEYELTRRLKGAISTDYRALSSAFIYTVSE